MRWGENDHMICIYLCCEGIIGWYYPKRLFFFLFLLRKIIKIETTTCVLLQRRVVWYFNSLHYKFCSQLNEYTYIFKPSLIVNHLSKAEVFVWALAMVTEASFLYIAVMWPLGGALFDLPFYIQRDLGSKELLTSWKFKEKGCCSFNYNNYKL